MEKDKKSPKKKMIKDSEKEKQTTALSSLPLSASGKEKPLSATYLPFYSPSPKMEKDKKSPDKNMIKDSEKEKQRWTLANLPLDILLGILSRLSAKFIFGCRLVLKSWLSLVRDPLLAEIHLSRASENENPAIIFDSYSENFFLVDDIEVSNLAVKLKFPFKKPLDIFKLVDSCNGLVCVVNAGIHFSWIHIFNPVTGEHRQISAPSFYPQNRLCLDAFCYHPPTKDYKILLKVMTDDFSEKNYFIYSLGTSIWKKIKDPQLIFSFYSPGTNLNGVIHWKSFPPPREVSSYSILSFDIGEEKYRVLEHPPERTLGIGCELGVLGGCLSLSFILDQKRAEIWVMKEYGLKESWTNLYVIERIGILADMASVRPLCILKSGIVILQTRVGELFFYDPRSKGVSAVQVIRPAIIQIYGPMIHVGTLVSLMTNRDRVES